MFTKIWYFMKGFFGSQTVKDVATTGVTIGLIKYPYMREPLISASQKVVDAVDQKDPRLQVDTFQYIKDIAYSEFMKSNPSVDQQLVLFGIMAMYGPKIMEYVKKVVPSGTLGAELKKMQEIRALAVTVNNAAGGKAV